MKLKYIGEDGNLKLGGIGLKNGDVIEGTDALLQRGDFELAENDPDKEPEEEIE